MTKGSGRGGWLVRARESVSGWLGIARFVAATPNMPPEEIAVSVLAHLAAHGRTSTHDLYLIFQDGNRPHLKGLPVPEGAPGYVTLVALFHVLQDLEEAGRIYHHDEPHEGRVQAFWTLNPWSGTRRRANAAGKAAEPDAVMAPSPARRDTLH